MFTRQETAAGAPGLTHASTLVSIKELIIRRYQQNPERKKNSTRTRGNDGCHQPMIANHTTIDRISRAPDHKDMMSIIMSLYPVGFIKTCELYTAD
jgi:hypothetical protein